MRLREAYDASRVRRHWDLAVGWCHQCSPNPAASGREGKEADARAAGGKSRSGTSRLAAALRAHPAFAGHGVLPGLGPASGAAADALRRGICIFSRRTRFVRDTAKEFCGEGGESDAGRRCFRRCRHGPGPVEFFSARHQLRSDRRSGSGAVDGSNDCRIANGIVPENPEESNQIVISAAAVGGVAERADQQWHVVMRVRVSYLENYWNLGIKRLRVLRLKVSTGVKSEAVSSRRERRFSEQRAAAAVRVGGS